MIKTTTEGADDNVFLVPKSKAKHMLQIRVELNMAFHRTHKCSALLKLEHSLYIVLKIVGGGIGEV